MDDNDTIPLTAPQLDSLEKVCRGDAAEFHATVATIGTPQSVMASVVYELAKRRRITEMLSSECVSGKPAEPVEAVKQ